MKSGSATLTLGNADRTYTGGTLVSEGTLKLSGTANLNALSSGDVTVADGAAIDLAGMAKGTNAHAPFKMYACGTGPDGKGAILNSGDGFGNYGIANLYLTGDLLIYAAKRMNFYTVYLQGHDLTYTGADQSAFTTVNNSSGGDIYMKSNSYTVFGNNALGNTANKSTFHLQGGQLNCWGSFNLGCTPISVEGSSTITAARSWIERFPVAVAVNAPLTIAGGASSYPNQAIVFNGGSISGSSLINVNTQYTSLGMGVAEKNNTFSGPIQNNGMLRIGHALSQNGSLTSGSVTNNTSTGKVIYDRQNAGTVSPREIVGGYLLFPTNLLDASVLTVSGSVLTNVQVQIHRGGLVLTNGATAYNGLYTLYSSSNSVLGKLSLYDCLVTNAALTEYNGTVTLGNGAKWIAPNSNFIIGHTENGYTAYTQTANLNIEEGSELVLKIFNVGHNGGAKVSTINQTGGSVRTTGFYTSGEEDGIRLGHYGSVDSTWNMSGGTLMIGEPYRLNLSIDGKGTFNLSGGEVYTTQFEVNGRKAGSNSSGKGTLNMTGGVLNIGTNGITRTSDKTTATYAINLGGGTIRASHEDGFSSSLNMTLTGTDGDVTFDTQSAAVTLSGVLSGAGGLKKAGSGVLTLSGANTYAGTTCVSNGTVVFTQAYPGGSLDVAADAVAAAQGAVVTAASSAPSAIRIVGADLLDAATFGERKTVFYSETALSAAPALTLVSSTGAVIDDPHWTLLLSSDGKSCRFGLRRGIIISIR